MKYTLRLDYATFNFVPESINPERLQNVLSAGTDFCWKRVGLSDNINLHSPLGLFWKSANGYAEYPHSLQVSGVGCTHFCLTLPFLRAAAECRFSRLDFAFDVIVSADSWKQFLCDAFNASMFSDRKQKKFVLTGSGNAMTVYIGARKSPYFFRIYNKTLEDKSYTYYDGEGNQVELSEDEYVIRYEIELKRFRRTLRGEKVLIDPSPLFDNYYSEDSSSLFDYIKQLWLSYGNDVLLPPDFADAEFVTYQSKQNTLFCSMSEESKCEVVSSQIHDYPHTFDRTLWFVTERYGKYIPYIVNDKPMLDICLTRCRLEFGFTPSIYCDASHYDFNDLDDDLDTGLPWNIFTGEQLPVDINFNNDWK